MRGVQKPKAGISTVSTDSTLPSYTSQRNTKNSIHAIRAFSYSHNFETLRLVSFGAPSTGRDYVDGETIYRSTRGFGWLQWGWNRRFPVIGHSSGASVPTTMWPQFRHSQIHVRQG